MEEETSLNLKEFGEIIIKRWKLILIITFASVFITGILSYFVIPPTYEASTSIIIGKAPGDHPSDEQQASNSDSIYLSQKLMKTYASIAQSDLVADKTVDKLNDGLTSEKLQKAIKVTPETDTQILDIKYDSRDPKQAMNVVNTFADTFIEESQKIYPTDNISIMDAAKLPEKPVKPKKALNVAIAFLVGLFASVGIVFILDYMDNTIKTEQDVDKFLQLPVIGVIPKNTGE